jgi:DNA processing protein
MGAEFAQPAPTFCRHGDVNPNPYLRLVGSALPLALSELPSPPNELFLHGQLPAGPSVAIVGTRRPSLEAALYAFQLAQCLAAAGVCVVSGGALGIDTQAHQGALTGGGQTLVVAPSSFDRPYPLENTSLYAQILAKGGGFLSAFERDVPARNPHFFTRNSHLVALCHAVVLVEAPFRSGARNAALWARKLRRPLFVVPAPPWNPRGLGCIVELKLGALPLYSYRDVLECLAERGCTVASPPKAEIQPLLELAQEPAATERLGSAGCPTPFDGLERLPQRLQKHFAPRISRGSDVVRASTKAVQATAPQNLTLQQQRLFDAVRLGAHYPEEIAAVAGLPLAEVTEGLLSLVLSRVLCAHHTGAYTVAETSVTTAR